MNKVILMGRLTKDPEVRYSQAAEPVAVTRYTLAVDRRFKRPNEPEADFINCVSFGKSGEFVGKYFKKGMLVSVSGSIRVSSWDDQTGQKRWQTDIVTDDHYFAESKASFEARSGGEYGAPQGSGHNAPQKPTPGQAMQNDSFFAIDQSLDDEDLPF